MKVKSQWRAAEYQVGAVEERSERLGGAGTADKDMGGGLKGWRNGGRGGWRGGKIMAGRYGGKILLARGNL